VPLDQISENLEGLGAQRNLFAATQQEPTFQVQTVISKAVLAYVAVKLSSVAQAAYSRQCILS
jgi:hypothetical protein